jgi:hypothetical protein
MEWGLKIFEGVEDPPDDTVIWRYLSFFSFEELVRLKKLRFHRADRFQDPLEGTLTEKEMEERRAASGLSPLEKLSVLTRQFAFVSCWRESDHESMAMWERYNRGEGTVAIKSTVGRLKSLLQKQREMCCVGKVNYVHRPTYSEQEVGPTVVFRKDISYDFEKEVRGVIFDAEAWGFEIGQSVAVEGGSAAQQQGELFQRLENLLQRTDVSQDEILALAVEALSIGAANIAFHTGIDVTVDDLSHLVTEIVIAPAEESQQLRSKALVELVAKDLGCKITRSSLLSKPY